MLINWNPIENSCRDLAGFLANDLSLCLTLTVPLTLSMQDMHILSTDQGQVFAAVQEWNQNDTYNLYISDPHGVYFTLALENVKTTRGLGGNSMIDLYEVGARHELAVALDCIAWIYIFLIFHTFLYLYMFL